MYSEPWAILMIRVTPKISDSPAATKNSPEGAGSPPSAWNSRPLALIEGSRETAKASAWRRRARRARRRVRDDARVQAQSNPSTLPVRCDRGPPVQAIRPGSACVSPRRGGRGAERRELSVRGRWAQLPDFGIGGQNRAPVDIFEIDHDRLAVLQRKLADIGAHRGLVIDGPVEERAERAIDLEPTERRHELVGIGGAGLADAGGERFHRGVADHGPEPRIIVEAFLIGGEKRLMLGRRDGVPGIAGHDPADRRLVFQRIEIFR